MMHKNNTQTLQQTVRFFETLLRASTDGIVITDPAKNIIFVNDTFCKFFSSNRQDVIETNLFIWLAKLDHNAKDIWKGLETRINEHGIAKDVEFASRTGEGMRYFSVNSSLLEKIDIEETGLIISLWRDDTERKMTQKALQRAHDELEMRVKERTAQLTNKNIELRNEITERKRVEKALQAERDNLVRIFEAMIDGVYIVDQKYDIQYVNPVLEKDFGSYEGRKCYEYFHDRTEVCPWCKNEDVFAGKTVRWEWYSPKNGRTYDLIDTPLINPDGTIYKLEMFRDITERKSIEKALWDSEEKYRTLVERSNDGILIIQDGLVKFANTRLAQLWGGTVEGLLETPITSHIHPDECNKVIDNYKRRLANENIPSIYETVLLCKDGAAINIEINAGIIRYQEKPADLVMIRDITERKRSDDEKNSLLKAIASSTDGITICDEKDRYIFVNPAYARIFGYSHEDFIGETWRKITPSDLIPGVEKGLEETLHNKDTGLFNGEVPGLKKDGSIVPTDVMATGLWDENGKYRGHICIVRDITERKLAEKERLQLLAREHKARAEAEAAKKLDRMKSMFLASTSHELRTPLNSVIGFSSMLLEGYSGQLNPEQKEQLELVHSSGKHLLTLINDIIDISKIEAGNIILEVSEFKLGPVVEEAISMLRGNFSQKKLDLKANVQDILMRTDRTRLFQCIVNLLSNAIKYTEKGSVEITVKVINNIVIIAVTDTGIGIAADDIPKLFNPFVRLQTPLTNKTSGTGLGLYLVKKIAKDFLGGDVEVESEFGKGSTFMMHIPVELEGKI